MSEFWARASLNVYRAAGSIAWPFLGGFVYWRSRKGKEDPVRRSERYGLPGKVRPEGPLVWLHAASVGESTAVMPLVALLENLGLRVVLTTGTTSSAALARERLSPLTIHQYAPLDVRPAVRRFLKHWQPDLAIFAESELWPVTMMELGQMRVPQVLVNARLSDRSFRRWGKQPALARALFEHLTLVIAQSELDGRRFQDLGAPRISVAGNLKVDNAPPPFDAADLERLGRQIGNRPVWVAVSTHKGEERLMAKTHALVAARIPDVLTIIVPRHPDRSPEVEAELASQGLNTVRRSSGAAITGTTQVYLGDTMGEMGLYLNLAKVAFLGKSLVSVGGQNPLEPAATGTAILSGQNVQNFRSSFEALLQRGGARLVKDETMLASHLVHLLTTEEKRRAMVEAAHATLAEMQGALGRTFAALDPFITPLRLHVGLGRGAARNGNKADEARPPTQGANGASAGVPDQERSS
jgi:3-deoxy-D-manno-octulosonic-acid transferase